VALCEIIRGQRLLRGWLHSAGAEHSDPRLTLGLTGLQPQRLAPSAFAAVLSRLKLILLRWLHAAGAELGGPFLDISRQTKGQTVALTFASLVVRDNRQAKGLQTET
jgi:hypothetical protein